MAVETVRGFRDVLYPEAVKRQKIKEVIEKNFKLFGFLPIETPSIEYEELAKGENEKDEAVSDRFRLKDRGNRDLALRYEFTFQLKRIFKENPNIKLPFRRYQIGYVFRDEPVEKNRYREFIQCDADIIGDASIKADAECLALADKICKELEIKYILKVNNRKLLSSILKRLDITDTENILRVLDKLNEKKCCLNDKEIAMNEDAVKKELLKYADKLQILSLFKILNKDLAFFVNGKYEGSEEVKELVRLCRIYKIKVVFSPFLFRGLSYYTGNIFEAYNPEVKGSIFAGGRFDNLVGKFINRKIPAVGISFGRILDYSDVKVDNVKCLIISIKQDNKAIELANKLRGKGISCFMIDKVSKGLEYADSYNIKKVIFLGKEEVKKKKYKLRDMVNGKEEMVGERELMEKLGN